MAYVAITEKLINEVEASMLKLRNAEIAAMGEDGKLVGAIKADPAFKEWFDLTVWGQEYDLMGRLAKYNRDGYYVLTIYTGSGFGFDLHIDHYRPCFAKEGDRYDRKRFRIERDHPLQALDTVKALIAYKEAVRECEQRWVSLIKGVKTLLESAKSLNEVVKLVPDMRRYFSAETLARLDKKAEKSTSKSEAAAALANLDVEALQASTVLARMAGAKV